MDDNYRHELEALERLAQAEEAERQRAVTGLCDWCGVNPAQRPNGECDDCWHMPGHEGEYEPTLEAEARQKRFEALERENARLLAFVEKWSNYDIWDLPTIGGFSDYDLGRSEILGYVSSEAAALLSEVTDGE